MSAKEYATQAEKQAAYRERRKQRRSQSSAGWTDAELGQAVRDIHLAIEADARAGNEQAAALLGDSPLETLRRLQQKALSEP